MNEEKVLLNFILTLISTIMQKKKNGVMLLIFLPHCSHRLQLLIGPFKIYFCSSQHDWMTLNAGKSISVDNFPSSASQAFNKAFTRDNILSSFKKCGISPFNNNIFDESDFLSAYATDRLSPHASLNKTIQL